MFVPSLSRACLGKKIVFTYKWLKKGVFAPRIPLLPRATSCKETVPFFECFPYVCSEPILVK
eukprot:COSAG06_NODE_4130_length_4539_cov_16.856532_1_plen_62_part_00